MANDRLLSPEERQDSYGKIKFIGDNSIDASEFADALLKAQDAKTAPIVRKEVNEEWVTWFEGNAAYSYFTDGKRITINVAMWQAHKKEVEL